MKELDQKYYMQNGQELASYVRAVDNTYYQLGVESFNSGNYEEAMADFQKANNAAATIDAYDDAAMINLAVCATKSGKYDVAAAAYEELI